MLQFRMAIQSGKLKWTIFVSLILLIKGVGPALQQAETPSPWDILQRQRPVLVLNAFSELTAAPAGGIRAFEIDMTGVRSLLEAVGLKQLPTIEIQIPSHHLTVNLGPFQPDSLAVPRMVKIKFRDAGSRSLTITLPQEGLLVFRDSAGTTRARLKAKFYFHPTPAISGFSLLLNRIENGQLQQAAAWCQEHKKKRRKECYKVLADILFHHGAYEEAAQYYEKCAEQDRFAGFQALGDAYFNNRRYHKAAAAYKKAAPSGRRAKGYGKIAAYYQKAGEPVPARKYYEQAVREYDSLIKSQHFAWKDIDNRDRLRCMQEWNRLTQTPAEMAREARLKKILKKCDVYCRRLYNASFDFVCLEEESQWLGEGSRPSINKGLRYNIRYNRADNSEKITYVYDYRLIRKNKETKEMRTLVRKNDRKVKETVIDPKADHPNVEKIIFGPVAMLVRYWQDYFVYRIIGEEVLWGEQTVILDVIPRSQMKINPLFGKVWIKETDGSVMKIELNPKSIENFQQALSQAKRDRAVPQIISVAEYGIEHIGVRFPSKFYLVNSYINKRGKRMTLAKQTHLYRDYHFFSVQTDVSYQ